MSDPQPLTQSEREAYEIHFASLAPKQITHFITVTLNRRGSAASFNLKWLPTAKLMSMIIIKNLDDEVYGRKPRSKRRLFPYLIRGETVQAVTYATCHLHFHAAADLTEPRFRERFEGRTNRFSRRVRAQFRNFGISAQVRIDRPDPLDRDKVANYLAKAAWVDVERFDRRDT